MKKILIILIFMALQCHAQRYQDQKTSLIPPQDQSDTQTSKIHLPEKVHVGGSVGLLIGPATYLDLSPLAGYEFKPGLILGVGGSYSYINFKERDPYTGAVLGHEDFSIYGTKIFGMYRIPFLEGIFLEADIQAVNAIDTNLPYLMDARQWLYSPLVGGGFKSELGKHSFYYMQILYDLNYYNNARIFTLSSSPLVIRGGVLF
jgi:hypothetical protein